MEEGFERICRALKRIAEDDTKSFDYLPCSFESKGTRTCKQNIV